MNKRAQFFLIAALIIITIVFSLGFIYNSATSSASSNKAQKLAEEIKYESLVAIENCILKCPNPTSPEQEIKERLIGSSGNPPKTGLIDYYASSNIDKNIIFIFGERKEIEAQSVFSEQDYAKGVKSEGLKPVDFRNNKLEVTFNNQKYVFEVKQGYNVFVIIEEDIGNEKTIASA